ncbi:MAG: type II toxin-antitoxin system HicB family antitoxin [Bacteroidetes bacterium]|nr:type II toxin-antitoxin system HicB family antitoxin [Bacteroidota bacterium]
MIIEYIRAAMSLATYEILEDKTFYGEIAGFRGVYANENSLEKCREELESVLEDWIIFSISKNQDLPIVNGLTLEVKEVE